MAMCAGASLSHYISFWSDRLYGSNNTAAGITFCIRLANPPIWCLITLLAGAIVLLVERQRIRLGALVIGALMLVSFIQVGQHLPFQSTGGIALGHLSMLELRFWMSHALLLVPGVSLVSWALAPVMADRVERLWAACLGLSRKNWLVLACVYFGVLLFFAVVGRSIFLLDLPITGDEYAVRFGARIWESGRLSVPILEPDGAFVQDFTYRHEGLVTAFEFPGVLFISAMSLVTGLGSFLYALMAATTGVLVASAAGVIMGRRGSIIAAIVWLGSPMASVFSMTEHGQLVSRFWIAAALFCYLRMVVASDRSWRTALGLGLAGTAAFLTRSAEAGFILAPILGHLLVCAWKEQGLRSRLALSAGIVTLGVAAYAWYNIQVTGSIVPARFGPDMHAVSHMQEYGYLQRLGNHLSQNWMLFVVMAIGPLGALFAAFAYCRREAWLLVLSASAALHLSLSLFHDNVGLHDVGPIHLSESVPIAIIITAVGVIEFVRWMRQAGVRSPELAVPIVGYFLCSMGIFTLIQSMTLRRQADVQAIVYDTVEAVVERPAIVVGLPPAMARTLSMDFMRAGGWAHEFPHPDPDLENPIIYARENFDIEALFARFPERSFYRIEYGQGGAPLQVLRIR